jgi:hypothetical protein
MKKLIFIAIMLLGSLSIFSQQYEKLTKEEKPKVFYALYHPLPHSHYDQANRSLFISFMKLEKLSDSIEASIKYDAEKIEATIRLDELMKEQEEKLKYVAPCID